MVYQMVLLGTVSHRIWYVVYHWYTKNGWYTNGILKWYNMVYQMV